MSVESFDENAFFRARGNFMAGNLTQAAVEKIMGAGALLLSGEPVIRVDDLLTADACAELEPVDFGYNDTATGSADELPFYVFGLLQFMKDLSRLRIPATTGLGNLLHSVQRLRYTPDNPHGHTLVGSHIDMGYGHSVVYNRNVQGPQIYRVNNETFPLLDNQLTILNSHAIITADGRTSTVYHSVEAASGLAAAELEGLARDRYIAVLDKIDR